MDQPYLIQSNAPLYPKVLWNRPLTKNSSGRLLLIGGHRDEFATIQAVYQYALASGIGHCTIALPDSLRPFLQNIDDTYFIPSSPSGSIGKGALGELTNIALEHDAISTGANLSNNSETTVVVERCLNESKRPSCLYLDAIDIVTLDLKIITEKSDICLVVSMAELFKLAGKLTIALNVRPEQGLLGRVEIVQTVAQELQASLVCCEQEIIVVSQGKTSVTPSINPKLILANYAMMSVFWTHKQTFEQLTTAAYVIQDISKRLSSDKSASTASVSKAISQAISAI